MTGQIREHEFRSEIQNSRLGSDFVLRILSLGETVGVRRLTEYVRLTLVASAGESEPSFKARLTAFWTHMLRNKPDDYERVFAEATRFEIENNRMKREYLVETDVVESLSAELLTHTIEFAPVDRDDTYTKYEATSPDWFQLDH